MEIVWRSLSESGCGEQARPLFDNLSASGLDGEVSLHERNLGFPAIAILSNEIAGIARQGKIQDLTIDIRADVHHFPDLRKNGFPSLLRRFYTLLWLC